MKLALKHIHGVKFNKNSVGTYQILIDGGRMRGVQGKKEERKSVRAMGKREPGGGGERESEARG